MPKSSNKNKNRQYRADRTPVQEITHPYQLVGKDAQKKDILMEKRFQQYFEDFKDENERSRELLSSFSSPMQILKEGNKIAIDFFIAGFYRKLLINIILIFLNIYHHF